MGQQLLDADLDNIDEKEIEAHEELREYAEAIKNRQNKFKLIDIAEVVVDNKMLINQVDDFLNQKHSADDGKKYHELPNLHSSVSES